MTIYAIYTGIDQDTLGWLFLQVLTFDIPVDWSKTQNFVPANNCCMHYGILKFTCLQIKLQKNVSVNNYHPKVLTQVMLNMAQIKVYKQLSW